MDRKEFLTSFGAGTAAVVCSYCLGGCQPTDPGITGPTNVSFTLDLTSSANSGLKSAGGYVYHSGVIVANTPNGYVALSSTCTHQGSTVYYDLNTNSFFCPAHGSRYDTSGAVLNGPAANPLTKYKTSINGNVLKVTS